MRLCGFTFSSDWQITPALIVTFVVFLCGAMAEELGYTGYATPALLRRVSPVGAGLILGVPWALWHLPSMIAVGQPIGLVLWGLAATIAIRVIYVLIYARGGGSLFAIVLLHALLNTGRSAFPGGRAGYEMGDAAIGYGLIIVLALAVIAVDKRAR